MIHFTLYTRSEHLRCDCPEEKKFQSIHTLWANQYGAEYRIWCPSKCGHYVQIREMKSEDYKPRVTRIRAKGN